MKAQINYEEHNIQINKNLDILKEKLKKHKSKFKNNPTNWGYVGDLEFVLNKLIEINQFLK